MSTQTHDESILDVFLLGLNTWLAEVKWLTKSVLTRFEISRLKKELDREYGMLGRIAEVPRGKKDEKELCLRQVAFLKEEIEVLQTELAKDREERMKNLRKDQEA